MAWDIGRTTSSVNQYLLLAHKLAFWCTHPKEGYFAKLRYGEGWEVLVPASSDLTDFVESPVGGLILS